MKANELRIGSILRWIDDPSRLLIVSEIGFNNQKNRFVRFQNGDGSIIEDQDCMIEPIPLTEEWLVRFGFEKTFENPFIEYEWQYGSFTMDNELNPYLGRYTNENDFKHVHQLQNLYFALTGEELKLTGK